MCCQRDTGRAESCGKRKFEAERRIHCTGKTSTSIKSRIRIVGDHDENCSQIIIRQVNGADSSKWVTSYVIP